MMESNWFGSKMLWRDVPCDSNGITWHNMVSYHIPTAPYFSLSQFLIPVLTRYKAEFFLYLTQKHHPNQFRLSHPDILAGS
jgi:hypothetical protein